LVNTNYYYRFFYSSLAALLGIWAFVSAYQSENITDAIIAIVSFILTVIASLGLLGGWYFQSRYAFIDFVVTYLILFLLIPFIWAGLNAFVLYGYAYFVAKCCEENWFLSVTLWSGLSDMYNEVFPAMWFGLVFFASAVLVQRHKSKTIFKWIASLIGAISIVGLIFSWAALYIL